MEGPITKYSDTANSLYEGNKVTYNSFCFGYQRVLYGYLKKIVISDRLNILVQTIFNGYTSYSGTAIFLGAVAYTIMLYMEFSGTMDVVIGIGEMFGVKITENFRQPFFSKNISEFWMRWHISLGTWFKDYIFYPVSLSKPMKKLTLKARKVLGNHGGALISGAVALFCVWFLNGLWHGAGWPFLLFGMYHFLLIVIGNIFEPLIISGQPLQLELLQEDIFSFVLSFVSLAIFLAAAGFSIYKFLEEKESSGELAGKPEGRDKLQMIIFHVGAGTIAFWNGMANGLISNLLLINVLTTVSSFIMFCALYYVFYGLIRRNFKLKAKDFAILVPVASTYIVSVVVYNIVFAISNA